MKIRDSLTRRLGFDSAPLGNVCHFDVAPFYRAELPGLRMGRALPGKPRDQYVLSTKIGRLILDEHEDVTAGDHGREGRRVPARPSQPRRERLH